MRCSKSVKLRGGFVVEVRSARKGYECSYCRKAIRPRSYYVSVRGFGVGTMGRYHLECFNNVMPHRLVAVLAGGRVEVCEVLRDDSAL